jgi:hypothetical protein
MKPIRVNKFVMPLVVVVALLGSVWVAKAAGLWQTSGRDQVLLDESGQADPAGIKGWMTLQDVADTYGLPLEAVYALIGAGAEIPADTALKDLESLLPDMEVSLVREGVAAYLAGTWSAADGPYGAEAPEANDGAPVDVEPTPEPTQAPDPTVAPTAEHVPQAQGQGDGSGSGFVLPEDGSRVPGAEIKGRMTLQEVVDYCQVPLDYLIAELGLPADVDAHLRMSELAGQFGLEVQTVRDVVSAYQAQP